MNQKSPRAAQSPVLLLSLWLRSRTEEEEVEGRRAPGDADTQSSANFHPPGVR